MSLYDHATNINELANLVGAVKTLMFPQNSREEQSDASSLDSRAGILGQFNGAVFESEDDQIPIFYLDHTDAIEGLLDRKGVTDMHLEIKSIKVNKTGQKVA